MTPHSSRGDRVMSPSSCDNLRAGSRLPALFPIRAMMRASVVRADHGQPIAAGNLVSRGSKAVSSLHALQAGGVCPHAPGTQESAHVGQIVTAEAGRNTPPNAGGFRGGHTAPHAPGALTECATFPNAAGGNSAKTKTTEMNDD